MSLYFVYGDREVKHRGRWAGLEFSSALPLPGSRLAPSVFAPVADPGETIDVRHDAPAFVAGATRHLRCTAGGNGYRLQITDIGRFALDVAAGVAECRPDDSARESAAALVFTGPCSALLLAERGIFQLHGSMFARNGRARAVLGTSGAGKSTLAAAADGVDGWQRVGDDVLAVSTSASETTVPGPLPQPKLAEGFIEHGRLSLERIYVLQPGPGPLRTKAAGLSEGTLALCRHSVAARLYSRPLLASHLAACGQISRCCEIVFLHYERVAPTIPAMIEELTRT